MVEGLRGRDKEGRGGGDQGCWLIVGLINLINFGPGIVTPIVLRYNKIRGFSSCRMNISVIEKKSYFLTYFVLQAILIMYS